MYFFEQTKKECSSEDVNDLLILESERIEIEITLRKTNQLFNGTFEENQQLLHVYEELDTQTFVEKGFINLSSPFHQNCEHNDYHCHDSKNLFNCTS